MKKIVLLISLIFLFSCSDEETNDDTNITISETISGTIVLPDGSPYDSNFLTLTSFNGISDVDNNNYSIKITKNEGNFIYVTDQSGDVVLMKFNHPNQTDFTIDSGSTLIAMYMSLPVSQSLSLEGQVDLLNNLEQSADFVDLKTELETLIQQGVSPLDINQDSFALNFMTFFNENLNRNSESNQNNEPVNIFQQGRNFIFQNPGKPYYTQIGVYKGDQRISTIELDRVKFVPTSISEILTGIFDNVTNDIDITEIPYTLPDENGDYTFRIRTGADFDNFSDEDAIAALSQNIFDVSVDILLDLLPTKKGSYTECAQTIAGNFRSYYNSVDDFQNVNSVQDILSYSYDKVIGFLTTSENIYFGCNPPGSSATAILDSIEKKAKWLKWIGILGNSANLSWTAYTWFNDDAMIDKCYTVDGNNVEECSFDAVTISRSYIDFGSVQIFTQSDLEYIDINNNTSGSVVLTIDRSGPFVSSNQITVPPNGLYMMSVYFSPTNAGGNSGSLNFYDSVNGDLYGSVQLYGNGVN